MPRVVREPRAVGRAGARAPAARIPERNPRNISNRPGRLRLMLRRRRRLARPVLGIALTGITILLLVGSAHGVATLRERLARWTGGWGLRIAAIEIEGRSNTPEAQVRAALGVTTGDPMLGFSVDAARTRLEALAWVKSAMVERVLPDHVRIAITERRPFAIWQHEGKFVLIDRDGGLVADEQVANFRQLPLVVGAGAPAAATALLDALKDRPAVGARVIASVRVAQRRWNLRLANGCDVMLPEGQEAAALDRLAKEQQEHQLLERPLQAIDLRLPDRIVMRPAPGAVTGAVPGAAPGGSTGKPA